MSYPQPDRDFQERAYREQFGPEKLGQQMQLAKTHWPCCWFPKERGHHPLCSVGQKAKS